MQDKIYSGSDHLDGRILLYNQSYFANYYDDSIFLVSNQAFFFFNIPAGVGPSVTLSGEMETY